MIRNKEDSNLLFFTCFNERSIQMESSIMYFKNRGHNVFFLTTCESGSIHKELLVNDVVAEEINFRKSFSVIYYIKMLFFLIKYCKKNNIQFLHSHLQIPNLISSVARFFIKAKVFNVRHNSDVIELSGSQKEKIIEKIINRCSNHIIAISDKVKQQLIEKEGVNPAKIYRINNGYNFLEYEKLSTGNSEYINIKQKYKCDYLIVSPGRLIKTKRHEITIKCVSELSLKGYDIKLLILGDGPEFNSITEFIDQQNIKNRVFLLGYLENISDYLKASDAVVLLSESEASSNVIKEAGYFEKPIIVCENVGDFSDYIINGFNGHLISKSNPESEFIETIAAFYKDKDMAHRLGINLKSTILQEFDIAAVGKKYEELQS